MRCVETLIEIYKRFEADQRSLSAIIFVKERHIAFLLSVSGVFFLSPQCFSAYKRAIVF